MEKIAMDGETERKTLRQILRSRRSIRKFTSAAVPAEVLAEILETAAFAPSAHGLQPWRFVHVQSLEAKDALAATLTGQMRHDMQAEHAPQAEIDRRVNISLRRMAVAPVLLLLCRDSAAVRAQQPEEDLMAIQSVAMAGLQLMLAAHTHGLGANWICWPLYAQAETSHALNLPLTWQPQGMVFLGHPAEEPKEKTLAPLAAIFQIR